MKKVLLLIIACLWAVPSIAAQQTVENGETMGQARTKINANFSELYGFDAALPTITWGTGLTDTSNTISVNIDDTKGNGHTTYIWSADKSFDELALKANLSCFASESAFNACFDLTWNSGGTGPADSSTIDGGDALAATGTTTIDGGAAN